LRKTHLAVAALAITALALAALAARASSARADGGTAFTYAIYGDAPYGAANHDITEMLNTPAFIDSVNADPDVSRVIHVGDIHSGKDHCYQSYNTDVYDLWQGIPFTVSGNVTNADGSKTAVTDATVASPGFDDPFVYTPGDNEWTDCNKSGEGGGTGGDGYYDASQTGHLPGDPLDNLAIVRSQFFATAGQTLGLNPANVTSQATAGPPNTAASSRTCGGSRAARCSSRSTCQAGRTTTPRPGSARPAPANASSTRRRFARRPTCSGWPRPTTWPSRTATVAW